MAHDKIYLMNGPAFIAQVLSDNDFQQRRYLQGKDGNVYYTVYDPKFFAMAVWLKSGVNNYDESAKALNAIVWTNGPQMDNPAIGKYTPHKAAAGVGVVTVLAAVGAWFLKATLVVALGVVAVVFIAGAALAFWWFKSQAKKFGVFSRTAGDWGEDAGREYTNWAWFGLNQPYKAFSSYQASPQSLPTWMKQLCGGMSPLVGGYQAFSTDPNSPRFSVEHAGAVGGASMAAWGLVPLPIDGKQQDEGQGLSPSNLADASLSRPDGTAIEGLVVVTATTNEAVRIAGMYVAIGAKIAVATDGSGSAMYGSQSDMLVPNPVTASWVGREELQRYGMCAK